MIICDICGAKSDSSMDRISDGEKFYDICHSCNAQLTEKLQANAAELQKAQEAIVKDFVGKK